MGGVLCSGRGCGMELLPEPGMGSLTCSSCNVSVVTTDTRIVRFFLIVWKYNQQTFTVVKCHYAGLIGAIVINLRLYPPSLFLLPFPSPKEKKNIRLITGKIVTGCGIVRVMPGVN